MALGWIEGFSWRKLTELLHQRRMVPLQTATGKCLNKHSISTSALKAVGTAETCLPSQCGPSIVWMCPEKKEKRVNPASRVEVPCGATDLHDMTWAPSHGFSVVLFIFLLLSTFPCGRVSILFCKHLFIYCVCVCVCVFTSTLPQHTCGDQRKTCRNRLVYFLGIVLKFSGLVPLS